MVPYLASEVSLPPSRTSSNSDNPRPFAVVTGASSGIGAAFAEDFAKQGANVLIIARRNARLAALAKKLRGTFNVSVDILVADLANHLELSAVEDALRKLDRIDFLVNCAGFGTYANFSDVDPQRIKNELSLDLVAPVVLTRAVLPIMLRLGTGTIINVSSMASFLPIPRHATYCAAKAGLTRFTEALHGELVGTGVRLHALCPGPVPTEFFSVSGYKLEDVPRYMLQPVSDCVDECFRGLQKQKIVYIPHWFIWLFVKVLRQFPLSARLRVLGTGPEWLNGKKELRTNTNDP